jgi:transcriptional regulator with XRE-family HTH domain
MPSPLRDERKAQGLSMRQLAYFAGTAPSTISRIERDLIADPAPSLQVRIASVLRCDVRKIFPKELARD